MFLTKAEARYGIFIFKSFMMIVNTRLKAAPADSAGLSHPSDSEDDIDKDEEDVQKLLTEITIHSLLLPCVCGIMRWLSKLFAVISSRVYTCFFEKWQKSGSL